MSSSLTPYQWLAEALRGNPSLFAESATNFNEEDLWVAGQENGVLSLISQKLSHPEHADAVTAMFRNRLQKYAMNAAARELLIQHELRKTLAEFAKANLQFLLIKGTPLGYTHYSDPYLRNRCDTDILFPHREAAEHAWQALEPLGYSRPNAVGRE